MTTTKELVTAILAIQKAQDLIDDGYHNREIFDLVAVKNRLFAQLPEETQKAYTDWYADKVARECGELPE